MARRSGAERRELDHAAATTRPGVPGEGRCLGDQLAQDEQIARHVPDDGGRTSTLPPAAEVHAEVAHVRHTETFGLVGMAGLRRDGSHAVEQAIQRVGRRGDGRVAWEEDLPDVDLGVGRRRVDRQATVCRPGHPLVVGERDAEGVAVRDAERTVLEGRERAGSLDVDERRGDGRARRFAVGSGATGAAASARTTGAAASAATDSATRFVDLAIAVVVDGRGAELGGVGRAGHGWAVMPVVRGVAGEDAFRDASAHTVGARLTDEGVRCAGVGRPPTTRVVQEAVQVDAVRGTDEMTGLATDRADLALEGVVDAGGARVGRVSGADRSSRAVRTEKVAWLPVRAADLIVGRVLRAGVATRIRHVAETGQVFSVGGADEVPGVTIHVRAGRPEEGVVEAGAAAPGVIGDTGDLEAVGIALAHVVPGLARRGIDAGLPVVRVILAGLAPGVESPAATGAAASAVAEILAAPGIAVVKASRVAGLVGAAGGVGRDEERHEGAQDEVLERVEPRGCRGTLLVSHESVLVVARLGQKIWIGV